MAIPVIESSEGELWAILCGFLVFLMQLGFAMLESSLERQKNSQGIIMKNILDTSVSGLVFWLLGFGFAFGTGPFIGTSDFAFSSEQHTAFFFLQWAFSTSAATIHGGAIAGRTRFMAFLISASCVSGFIYPVAAHWMWQEDGWLFKLDALDFSGGGVIHMLGGVIGFVGAIVVGPRLGRFTPDGKGKPIRRHHITNTAFGTFILWFGWFGFNCGSSVTLPASVQARTASIVALNTTLAPCMAALVVFALERWDTETYDLGTLCNGVLGGLVAITAPCAYVRPWAAIVIGAISALAMTYTSRFVSRNAIDDMVDAFAVHGACGAWGLIAIGLFADPDLLFIDRTGGLFYSGDLSLLGVQVLSVVAIGAWAALMSWCVFRGLKYKGILRMDRATELLGQDLAKHTGSSYPDFEMKAEDECATSSI